MIKVGSTLRYVQKKGLYYYESKKGDVMSCAYSQLVIPSKLRREILKQAHDRIMTENLGIQTRQMESEVTDKNTKVSCLSELESDVDNTGNTHISAETELHFPIYLTKETVNEVKVNSGLEVIKLEFILKLKIKRNDWLLADTSIIALYFELETSGQKAN